MCNIIKSDIKGIFDIYNNFKYSFCISLAACGVKFYNKLYKFFILESYIINNYNFKLKTLEKNTFQIDITTENGVTGEIWIDYDLPEIKEDGGIISPLSSWYLTNDGSFLKIRFNLRTGKIINKEICEEFPDNIFDWSEEELFYWKLKNTK